MAKRKIGLILALAAAVVLLLALVSKVADFSAPKLVLVDAYEGAYGQKITVYDLVKSVKDKTEVTLTLSGEGEVEEGEQCITFRQAGQYTVEVTATDARGNETTEQTDVTITDSVPPELSATTLTVYQGETPDYSSAVTAEDEADGDLTDQVTVDDSQVDLDTPGTYEVTYTVADRSGNETSCVGKVVVQSAPAETITLSQTELSLSGNGYSQLQAEVQPSDWEGTVVWTSSDTSVATVSDGLVYWQGVGECVITAQADDVQAQCKVTCGEVPPTSVTLNKHTLTLEEGDSVTLSWSALPSNWTGGVTWVSSNEAIATVEDGTVTWAGYGTCTITVYASDTVYDVCEVTCKGLTIQEFFENVFGGSEDETETSADETAHKKGHNGNT